MRVKPELEDYEDAILALEEEMPESQTQIDLSDYLRDLLRYMYLMVDSFITGNLAVFPPTKDYPFTYLAPDVALFKGVKVSEEEKVHLNSWLMRKPNRPAPTVVFEISSKDTWQQDLDPKPTHYHLLGVREYFAYDPQGYWPGERRLRGWNYANNMVEELEPDDRGWLWSAELESYLVPNGPYLRLYDREGNIRLTEKEAALLQAEQERAALQALLEKLRQRNIDPDSL
jgi:Uma2 family endonuclease